jgi:hypothetical protein
VQRSTLLWWLHLPPGSLQAKFHLDPRRHTSTLLDDFCVLNFFGRGEPLCLHFLDCSLVYGSYIWIQVSTIGTKWLKNHTGSQRNWSKMACKVSTRARFWSTLRHLETHLAESILMSKISWIIYPTLSRNITRVSVIFVANILQFPGIMEQHSCFLELSLELVSQKVLRLQCSNVLF